jgi:cephalosporin hydroxylase
MSQLPPPVTVSLDESLNDYWLKRLRQHPRDSYAGVECWKFPEDLRVYEHLIWTSRPNTVIEIGTRHGGSAMWFRDRLVTLESYGLIEHPLVISIDLDIQTARLNIESSGGKRDDIILLEGDLKDPAVVDEVQRCLPGGGASCMVVDDSAHTYESTMASLRGFSRFVAPGGFFVVEDGCVDIEELRAYPIWPRGVLPAIRDWLDTPQGAEFRMRRDLELYGVTSHPQGFLQRAQ